VSEPERRSWKDVHPDFDGHLETPIEKMTMQERLAWAWEGMVLLHWARQARRKDDCSGRDEASRNDDGG
jgi:hypothetical protein